jgi:hypothetical protein
VGKEKVAVETFNVLKNPVGSPAKQLRTVHAGKTIGIPKPVVVVDSQDLWGIYSTSKTYHPN